MTNEQSIINVLVIRLVIDFCMACGSCYGRIIYNKIAMLSCISRPQFCVILSCCYISKIMKLLLTHDFYEFKEFCDLDCSVLVVGA